MGQLDISNIISISVASAPVGLGEYNTSNVALFTDDTPGMDFPVDGFAIYKSPKAVGTDFGTDSITYKMALRLFSQQPNILANNGYLVIIPLEPSETLVQAINRTESLVQYFAILANTIQSQTDMLAAAAVVQTLNKMALFVSRTEADIETGGKLQLLTANGYTQSRGLYYGGADDDSALLFMAGYAGRGFSVDFSGSLTTITMNLKSIVGSVADPSMTQTIYNKALLAGADTYPSFAGVAKVRCSGANQFFDQVYNLQWFVGALQIALFNFLAQTSTKIPQTENGMDGLKGAARNICEEAVTNQYCAPGVWNDPTTFGNQADLLENVAQRGYYIYSQPIGQQSQADREAREAPLVQIALKEAGAIQTASVIIYVNP